MNIKFFPNNYGGITIVNSNACTPEKYHNRYKLNNRERYLQLHWHPQIERLIQTYCSDKRTLDLGCGTGTYLTVIKKYTEIIVGLDISLKMIRYIKSSEPMMPLVIGDSHRTPFKASSFDTITCIGLFEYVNRDLVVKEMNRLLPKGGMCIIPCPNKYSAIRMIPKILLKCLKKQYPCDEPSKNELTKLLKKNDFELIEIIQDDGLIWLPDSLDKIIGIKVYSAIEFFFKIFKENPFSNIMVFVVRKR